nr:FAD-dependent oxidoreductase [bacterium]
LHAARSSADFGVEVAESSVSFDMRRVAARKDAIVSKLRDGIASLVKGRGIDFIKGAAAFSGPGKISVDGSELSAKRVLIATGSTWIELKNLPTDGISIVTSDEALSWTEVPRSVVIVGGGVIGCEFACMLRAFGAEVTVVEATPSILPPVERAVSRLLARSMKGEGISLVAGTTVESAKVEGGEVLYRLSGGEERRAAKMMVAVGRRPLTAGLNLEAAGVALTERGFVKVDSNFKTTAEDVYAIGDVVGQPMLAHAASAEGIAAVEGMFGDGGGGYDPSLCPSPIFTTPEIGAVGKTQEELTAAGVEFKTGRFSYAACGKALCDGESDGQAVVHADPAGRILGVHIVGREAATMIAEAALAMRRGLTVKEVAETVHAHPTLSEIFAEACEDAMGLAIHKAASRRS